jgi:peptide chain release factor 1
MRHRPTNIEAKSAAKSQHRNKVIARAMLEARVAAFYADKAKAAETSERRQMVGSGMRGDKIRTYRVRDDQVTDHRTGRKMRLQEIVAGRLP